MENFILYLGKASALLAVFFLAYYFLLRKETFFSANRWFLLAGIATSLALPFVIFKKVIWIEPQIRETFRRPININNLPQEFTQIEETGFEINWFYVIGGIYLLGIAFLLLKFIRDFYSLKKIFKNQTVKVSEGFKFVDTDQIQSPFSFFKYIVFNSSTFQKEELDNILEHEKVHSAQYHSADMIIGQLFCIAFWFNPFAWLHKKAITQNLEFIADSTALKIVSDRITYQKTLLKVSAPHHCIPITNYFFQSLIKKRIVMLNTDQSKRRNSLKYLAVLPLLTLFMLQFQVKTVAQEKNQNAKQAAYSGTEVVVDKNSSDDDLKQKSEALKKDGVTLKFSKVKRNSSNEIVAIKTSCKDSNGNSSNTFQKSDKPIEPFKIIKTDKELVITGTKSPVHQVTKDGTSVYFRSGYIDPNAPVPPTAPVAPVMPNMTNMPVAPPAPAMPPAPAVPNVAYDENSEVWKKYEKDMEQFEIQMKAKEGEFAKFEKEMENYGKEFERIFTPEFEKQMAEFDKQMEKFDKKMKAFEVEMESYQKKLLKDLED